MLCMALAFTLMAVSFCELLPQFGFIFDGDNVLRSVTGSKILGTRLGDEIIWFICAQLLLYCAYAIALFATARATAMVLRPRQPQRTIILGWFLASAAAILASSACLYPWSIAGEYYGRFARSGTIAYYFVLGFGTLVLAAALGVVAIAAIKLVSRHMPRLSSPAWIAGIVIVTSAVTLAVWSQPEAAHSKLFEKPHVILLGVDSLRRDMTDIAGDGEITPNISTFLRSAQSFTDATTPLARTYPSWMSILSGRHPRTTGALMNLINPGRVNVSPTVAEILRQNGYQTIFGMDEVRFANIDDSYGFDQVISPPMGASDFLLVTINDTPLGNLVMNSAVGRWLFPNSYANRAASAVYDPDLFVKRIEQEVEFSKPTFLAIHLTLPHWPYTWSKASFTMESSYEDKYQESVRRVDDQFGAIMDVLERKGAFRNAVVVVLSDHGEGLNRPNDLLLRPEHRYTIPGAVPVIGMAGHGTCVLSPPQFEVVLGFKGYGPAPLANLEPTRIDEPVSVEDIAPTIVDLLDISAPEVAFDGWSLEGLLQRQFDAEAFASRVRFTETEFNPPELKAGANAAKVIAAKNAKYYHVDEHTGRLLVKEDRLARALAGRQFAAIGARQLLAAFPSGDHYYYKFLLIDRDGERFTTYDLPPTDEADPKIQALWRGLEERFGSVITTDPSLAPGSATDGERVSASDNQI